MAEEAALERELEEQWGEHKASLTMLREALVQDPTNLEISMLCEELVSAVRECEESLVYLKRTRLLREIENPTTAPAPAPSSNHDESGFVVGSKCRFRFTDGRWYNGRILEMQDSQNALVSFLMPTDDRMQICKFFMQQRCRFGESCRLSHGFKVSVSTLEKFLPGKPGDIEIGSLVMASSFEDGSGVWRNAEVEEWDSASQTGRVVFTDDGTRCNVDSETVAVTVAVRERAAAVVPDASEGSSSESEDEADIGIGFVNGSGQQTETVAFATWEKHTKGVASKLMAMMGYKAGTGLGLNSQGVVAPLQVKVLPPGKSLDFVRERGAEKSKNGPKKSRGGKRKRERKFAEASRAAKAAEAQHEDGDVFEFINVQLASSSGRNEALLTGDDQFSLIGHDRLGSSGKKNKQTTGPSKVKEDRYTLVLKEDEIKHLAGKVAKLEEMAHRNRKEKAVFQGVSRKLSEARKELHDAQEAHSSMAKAVLNKEQSKKWSKF